jgi:hypothetical protein
MCSQHSLKTSGSISRSATQALLGFPQKSVHRQSKLRSEAAARLFCILQPIPLLQSNDRQARKRNS